jgi:hypothetical protein
MADGPWRLTKVGYKLAEGKGLREGWGSKEMWKSVEKSDVPRNGTPVVCFRELR